MGNPKQTDQPIDTKSSEPDAEGVTYTPLVSVIVPVYNVLPYIHEALDSVVNQTYCKLEIIVIDDGSTDGSSKVCDDYAQNDSRIRAIHQQNRGLSAARNAGLDIAKGDVIGFLDPDDTYDGTFVEELLRAMDQNDSDVAVCHYTIHYTEHPMFRKESDKPVPPINAGAYGRIEILHALADGALNVSVWNKLYRRKLWKDVRFRDGHVYEDNEASLCVFDLCESVCVIPQPLLLHRKRRDSITSTGSEANMRDMILAASYFVSFVASRTPEVFTLTQLEARQHTLLGRMITAYANLPWEEDDESRAFRRILRSKISEYGDELGINDCGHRMRIAYHMVSYPPLLRIVYSLERSLRLASRLYAVRSFK